MEKYECPYAQQVGSMQADIAAQKIKIAKLQSEFDLLTIGQIKEEAEKNGLLKGMKIAAMVIGYTIITVLFVIAGKAFGFVEVFAKIFKL